MWETLWIGDSGFHYGWNCCCCFCGEVKDRHYFASTRRAVAGGTQVVLGWLRFRGERERQLPHRRRELSRVGEAPGGVVVGCYCRPWLKSEGEGADVGLHNVAHKNFGHFTFYRYTKINDREHPRCSLHPQSVDSTIDLPVPY